MAAQEADNARKRVGERERACSTGVLLGRCRAKAEKLRDKTRHVALGAQQRIGDKASITFHAQLA